MNARGVVFTFLIELVLVLSAVQAFLEKNTFWIFIAILSSFIVWIPLFRSSGSDRPLVSWIIILTVATFFIDIVMPNHNILQFSSSWYWLASSVSIFALSLATLAIAGSYGSLRMNCSFNMLLAYLLFESLVVIQGPIDYYSDILLGTSQISNNFSLMIYIIQATICGLFLTVAFYFILKNTMLAHHSEHRLEVEEE